jgi:hypothetical protein
MKMDYGNSARGLKDLSAEQQALLVGWIRDVLVRAQSVFARNSYLICHQARSTCEPRSGSSPRGDSPSPASTMACKPNVCNQNGELRSGWIRGKQRANLRDKELNQGRSHHPRRAPFWPVRELPTDSASPAERSCHVPGSPFFVTA